MFSSAVLRLLHAASLPIFVCLFETIYFYHQLPVEATLSDEPWDPFSFVFMCISVVVSIRSGICSETLTCPSALAVLWFTLKTGLRGYALDSFQMRTNPKDVLKEHTSYIPTTDIWTVSGLSLTPLQNKTLKVYILLLDPQHQLFLSATVITQTRNCYHKTLIVPVFFLFHTLLHFSAFEPWTLLPKFLQKCLWECKDMDTDNGPWQSG